MEALSRESSALEAILITLFAQTERKGPKYAALVQMHTAVTSCKWIVHHPLSSPYEMRNVVAVVSRVARHFDFPAEPLYLYLSWRVATLSKSMLEFLEERRALRALMFQATASRPVTSTATGARHGSGTPQDASTKPSPHTR